MSSIMFLGTSSYAGKTLLSAVYCRHLASEGRDVVPFKASDLTSDVFTTSDGKKMGMGQAVQAWVSGTEPETDMNPVLMMPGKSRTVDVLVGGIRRYTISGGCEPDTDDLLGYALDSFDNLTEKHDAVVCEGAGSPVEMNLIDRDIANMKMVTERNIPSVLVADIERGGVFAAIYGTWKLIPEKDRCHLKGYIINRFRGEESVLKDGIDTICELTGMKCYGVVPYVDLRKPDTHSDNISERFTKEIDRIMPEIEKHLDFSGLDSLLS